MISKITGFAGDLFVPSRKYLQMTGGYTNYPELKGLVTIADLFLAHDNVSFRADITTLQELYNCFTMDEMDEMLLNKRISFYLPVCHLGYQNEWLNIIEEHFNKIANDGFLKDDINASKISKQIADNLLDLAVSNEKFIPFESEMKELFYRHGIQRDSFFTMDVRIGFDQAIEKIKELWSCGLLSTTLDEEVLFYFDICDKAAFLKEKGLPISDINTNSGQIVDQLHNYKNCPSLANILFEASNPTRKMIDIVNSSEASDLRGWLQKEMGKDVDVRDLYNSTISSLPSKNQWIDWIRFGGVSVVTGILSTILTADSVIGMLIGTGGGGIDKIYGSNLIDKASQKYSPDAWFKFLKSSQ